MRSLLLVALLLSMIAGCGPPVPQPTQPSRLGAQTPLVPTADGTSWVWRSDTHGFEVTIPSERWKVTPNPNVVPKFDCPRPLLVASIIWVRPAESDAEYEAARSEGLTVKRGTPTTNTDERTGPNSHGHDHWMYMGDVTGGPQPYCLGISITRIRGKAVLLMFEGPYKEAQALRPQAELFLRSVR